MKFPSFIVNKYSGIVAAFLLLLQVAFAQNCQVEIQSPAHGSNVSGYPIMVSGSVDIPAGKHLWILVSPIGMKAYWPQGSGEASTVNGAWKTAVFLGDGRSGGEFEILAIVVDGANHSSLTQWVKDNNKPPYPPLLDLPTPMDGCPIERVLVVKN